MTNRERIVATLKCERTDRPPVIDWLGLAPWGETLSRWRDESGVADLEPKAWFGYDRGFLVAPLELGPWPRYEHVVLEESEETVTYRDYRGITIRNRKDGNTLPDFLSGPVGSRADWERYRDERLQPRLADRTRALDEFVAAAASTDAPVQVGTYPYGFFGTPRDLTGVESVLVGYYDEPEMLHEIARAHADLWLALYAEVAARVQIDHVHIWEDMSGKQGSLISMPMVEEFMMPGYDRIAAFVRSHDVAAFSVDTDGKVDELVATMAPHGVNSFFPFEVQAGNDIVEYRRRYPDVSVWGGLDKRALADDRAAIHRELDRAAELFALGGYIVGFDHLIPPDVPWESFRYFMDELWRIVGRR